MDRIRRISEQLLEKHPELFNTDFEKNKESLGIVAEVRSKMLRNKIAGYIAKLEKDELEEEEEERQAGQEQE